MTTNKQDYYDTPAGRKAVAAGLRRYAALHREYANTYNYASNMHKAALCEAGAARLEAAND